MLSKKIADIMIPVSEFRTVASDDYFRDAIEALNFNHWGGVFIINKENSVDGILTDGDARRIMVKNQAPLAMLNSTPISDLMIKDPQVLNSESTAKEALMLMNEKSILMLPVVDGSNKLIGLVHLQHAVREVLL